jgi:hypothetical protein
VCVCVCVCGWVGVCLSLILSVRGATWTGTGTAFGLFYVSFMSRLRLLYEDTDRAKSVDEDTDICQ